MPRYVTLILGFFLFVFIVTIFIITKGASSTETLSSESLSGDERISIRGDRFYFEKQEIPWLDPSKVRYLGKLGNWSNKYYFADSEKAYLVSPEGGDRKGDLGSEFLIREITVDDPRTLELFGPHNAYARDDNSVYINDVVFQNSTRPSPDFDLVKIEGAQPETFEIIQLDEEERSPCKGIDNCYESLYATDGHNVFYGDDMIEDRVLLDVFRLLPHGPYQLNYATDNVHVFYKGRILKDADADSFTALGHQPYEGCDKGDYAIDATHVYYQNVLIEGADPATFEVVTGDYGKDKNGYYHLWRPIDIEPDDYRLECRYG